MSLTSEIFKASEELYKELKENEIQISTAESCTGGLISSSITSISGSSAIFDRGFVTYSNEAKMELLGVSLKTLQNHGAVSAEVAREMAEGAISKSYATISIATTGIAGPTGGSDDKPVGTVAIAICKKNGRTISKIYNFDGNREEVRQKATLKALNEALITIKA